MYMDVCFSTCWCVSLQVCVFQYMDVCFSTEMCFCTWLWVSVHGCVFLYMDVCFSDRRCLYIEEQDIHSGITDNLT